jgi:hypothetical protein
MIIEHQAKVSYMGSYQPRFLFQFCNWESLRTIIVTIDIDFAPDFMIADTIELLERWSCAASIFVTHGGHYIQEIERNNLFEVGLHPNLMAGSTQPGESNGKKIEELKNIVKGPISNKFHVLGYSYRDLTLLGQLGIEFDCSMCYYETPFMLPTYHQDIDLVLAPYWWEDGLTLSMGRPLTLNKTALQEPGLKILTFHPLDLYMNTSTFKHRNKIKGLRGSITDLKKKDVALLRNQTFRGTRDCFIDLMRYASSHDVDFVTCKELNTAFRKTFSSLM